MKYNIIIHKKIGRTPQTPLGGRERGNLRENFTFFTVFCLYRKLGVDLKDFGLKITSLAPYGHLPANFVAHFSTTDLES